MGLKVTKTQTARSEESEAPRQSRSRSKADAFNAVKAGGGNFPAGKHELRIIEAELQVKEDDSESVMFKYEGTEGDIEGKTSSQWYGILTDTGEAGKGVGFLRRDLEMLGFDESETEYDALKSTLKRLTEMAPLCICTVKQNGAFTNIYLNSVVDEGN